MKKNKNTIITTLFLLLTGFLFGLRQDMNLAFAQEKTEVTEASESSDTADSIQDIKQIIKENIENNKVKGAIDSLLNRKIGIIGQVERITDETLTITNTAGTRILAIDDTSKIFKGSKEVAADTIEVENWVTVLGKLKDDTFSPNFIYVFSETLRPKTQVVMLGTIQSISDTEITLLPRSGEKETSLDLTKNTNYQDSDGSEAKLTDFSEEITVIVTGFDDDGDLSAATVKSLAELSDE